MKHNIKYLVLLALILIPIAIVNAIAYLGVANTVGIFTLLIAAMLYPAYCRMIDNDVKLGKLMTSEDYQADDLQRSLNSINFNTSK